MRRILLLALLLTLPTPAIASGPYALTPGQDLIGELRVAFAHDDDTLLDIARDYDLGYNEITAANPGIDPWIPDIGQQVTVPTARLLPSAKRVGIVLNLGEMRLYYFYKEGGRDVVTTYPIGVGKDGFNTPLGVFSVTGKEKDPTWRPTAASKNEKPELPDLVPPGPDNPLGGYKVTLSIPGSYLLHSTNRPWGVGRRVSHGCIRFYPEDMARFFNIVKSGTRVEIVYQPVKVGLYNGRLIVEVHDDYLGTKDLLDEAEREITRRGLADMLDTDRLDKAVKEKSGLPTDVTLIPEPPPEAPVDTTITIY